MGSGLFIFCIVLCRVLRGHRGSVLTLCALGGLLLSGGRDNVIRVWVRCFPFTNLFHTSRSWPHAAPPSLKHHLQQMAHTLCVRTPLSSMLRHRRMHA